MKNNWQFVFVFVFFFFPERIAYAQWKLNFWQLDSPKEAFTTSRNTMGCAGALDELVLLFSSKPLSFSPPLVLHNHWFFVWLDVSHLSSYLSLLIEENIHCKLKGKAGVCSNENQFTSRLRLWKTEYQVHLLPVKTFGNIIDISSDRQRIEENKRFALQAESVVSVHSWNRPSLTHYASLVHHANFILNTKV